MRRHTVILVAIASVVLVSLWPSQARSGGQCYTGFSERLYNGIKLRRTEFCTCSKESDCAAPAGLYPWVVLTLEGGLWWGSSGYKTKAKAEEAKKHKTTIYEPKGLTVEGPYPRCPPSLGNCAPRGDVSSAIKMDVGRRLLGLVKPDVKRLIVLWAQSRFATADAAMLGAKVWHYKQSAEKLELRIQTLSGLLSRVQDEVQRQLADRIGEVSDEVESAVADTNRAYGGLSPADKVKYVPVTSVDHVRPEAMKAKFESLFEAGAYKNALATIGDLRETSETNSPDPMYFEARALVGLGERELARPIIEQYLKRPGASGRYYEQAASLLRDLDTKPATN